MPHRILVWDLPTRLFHWLLVALVVTAIITGKIGGGAIVWHGRIGVAIVGLLAFRIIWGFVGSSHSRFASFFPTPGKMVAYLRGHWRGPGHNPLGALSAFGLMALVALQVASGLLANDDIAFQGYLSGLIDKSLSDRLTGLHKLAFNALLVMIALHLAAIAFYAHVKKDNLVKPMITGWKEVEHHHPAPTGGGIGRLVLALAVAGLAVYGASGQWMPTPPQPAVAPASPPAANW